MSQFKDYIYNTYGIRYYLTYADNYAVGYFRKQVGRLWMWWVQERACRDSPRRLRWMNPYGRATSKTTKEVP